MPEELITSEPEAINPETTIAADATSGPLEVPAAIEAARVAAEAEATATKTLHDAERAEWDNQRQQSQARQVQLEQELQTAQAAETARTRANQLEATGQYDAQAARVLAENEVQRGLAEKQVQAGQIREEQLARQLTAQHYAREYGVGAATLLSYNSPQAMELAAKANSGATKEIATLREEIAAMKKEAVPVQTFEGGAGDGAGVEGDALIKALDNGAELTPARMKAASKYLGLEY